MDFLQIVQPVSLHPTLLHVVMCIFPLQVVRGELSWWGAAALHLVGRKVEVLLIPNDLPDLLQAQRQSIPWQLVSAHTDQCVLICVISQQLSDPSKMGVVGQRHVLHDLLRAHICLIC